MAEYEIDARSADYDLHRWQHYEVFLDGKHLPHCIAVTPGEHGRALVRCRVGRRLIVDPKTGKALIGEVTGPIELRKRDGLPAVQ